MVVLLSCKKNTTSGVPNVAVDFYIYLTQPAYSSLNGVGNHVYVTGGADGIIIYHKTIDEFAAYDRACPYDYYSVSAQVIVESNGLFAFDSLHCKSKFNLLDGSVQNGPASQSLKAYAADYDGSTIVHVHN
jgi:nitrite reductase/ring-hydroxylating ferredoxin subunit